MWMMYPNTIWFCSGDGYVKLAQPDQHRLGERRHHRAAYEMDQRRRAVDRLEHRRRSKATYKWWADDGWVLLNDGSIGDANSGAVTRFNSDTWPLFNLLWWGTSDDWCSLYAAYTWTRTGRGASPEADFAAHRHILLPKVLGRVLAMPATGARVVCLRVGNLARPGVRDVGYRTHAVARSHDAGAPAFHTAARPSLRSRPDLTEQLELQRPGRLPDGDTDDDGPRLTPAGRPAPDCTIIGGSGTLWTRRSAAPAGPAVPAAVSRTSTSSRRLTVIT